MSNQSKMVNLAMIILFLALIVVYVLFYQIHGNRLAALVQKPVQSTGTSVTYQQNPNLQNSNQVSASLEPLPENSEDGSWWVTDLLGVLYSDMASGDDAAQEQGDIGNASTDGSPSTLTDGPKILSGTEMFFGVVDAIDILDLNPEYLLQDAKWIYYARLKAYPSNLKTLVQSLWGTIYTMTTEKEILENQLFGDRITYVNLPEYKNILVIMIVNVHWEYWLIQLNYPQYHHAKGYLQSLFL